MYEEARLPFTNDLMRRSALCADIGHFNDARFANLAGSSSQEVDVDNLWDMGHAFIDNWKRAWTTSIDTDEARAIKMLEERAA